MSVVKVHPPDIEPPVGVPPGPIETLEKYSIEAGNVPERGSYITVKDGEEYVTHRVQETEIVIQDAFVVHRVYTAERE